MTAVVPITVFDLATSGTFTRASPATSWDEATQTFTRYAAGVRRILTSGRILIEGTTTNELFPSNPWTVPPWAVLTQDSGLPAPDGSNDAALRNAVAGGRGVNTVTIPLTVGIEPYTLSNWAQRDDPDDNEFWALGANAGGSLGFIPFELTENWIRRASRFDVPNGQTSVIFIFSAAPENMGGGAAGDARGWGAQVENGNFPTSLVETVGAVAVREPDDLALDVVDNATLASFRGISFTHSPIFNSADAYIPHAAYALAEIVPTDSLETSYSLALDVDQVTGDVMFEVNTFNPAANLLTVGVTFVEDAELNVEWNAAAGTVNLSGFTTGNGVHNLTPQTIDTPFNVRLGNISFGGPSGIVFGFGTFTSPALLLERPEILGAEQITLNTVRVTFEEPPKTFDPTSSNDALNLANYTISEAAGADLPRLQHVAKAPGNAVDLIFDQPLLPAGLVVTLAVRNVATPGADQTTTDDDTPFVEADLSFTTYGVDREPSIGAVQTRANRFDLANPQTPRDADGEPLGTFSYDEAGDLANDTGRRNLRKRIFRRLSTRQSGFSHLGDSYGLRFESKRLVTPTFLRELQNNIEQQIRAEPDVVTARALLRELRPGLVGLRLRVEDNLGPFEFEMAIDVGGEGG